MLTPHGLNISSLFPYLNGGSEKTIELFILESVSPSLVKYFHFAWPLPQLWKCNCLHQSSKIIWIITPQRGNNYPWEVWVVGLWRLETQPPTAGGGVCPSWEPTMLPTSPPGFGGNLSGCGTRWLVMTLLCNVGCICLLLLGCENLQIIAKSAGVIGLWCIWTDGWSLPGHYFPEWLGRHLALRCPIWDTLKVMGFHRIFERPPQTEVIQTTVWSPRKPLPQSSWVGGAFIVARCKPN